MITKLVLIIVFLLGFNFSKAQLTIQAGISDTAMITLLQGLQVSILNLTINCHDSAYGHFSGTSELAITNGVVMSTGMVSSLADSNTFSQTSNALITLGDSDLTILSGATTHDACALEFDCIPTGDTLEFNFAFGSEEYPEWVGTSFNDIFAILLSGPGITGAQNVATIPGGTPVAINNVNAFYNTAYYYDNENPYGQYVSFDGFTLNLTAFAVVIPYSTYHFKVVIADVSDWSWNSAVFLEAFSFRSNGEGSQTGIKSPNNARMNIFPNPADGHFTITSSVNLTQVRIMNLTGMVLQEFSTTEKYLRLNTSQLPEGVYFIESVSDKNVLINKLIIQ